MERLKTLTTIGCWIVFVFGCVGLVLGFIKLGTCGFTLLPVVYFAAGIASLTLAACIAKLRQMLE